MTIAVTIKNEDDRENAIIGVQCCGCDEHGNIDPAVLVECHKTELKGGESHECHVHSGCQIVVTEIQNG